MTVTIFGIDFTSAPHARKAIMCAECQLRAHRLTVSRCRALTSFAEFEAFLRHEGCWLAACDFPFGQPRKLIINLGWPSSWPNYIQWVTAMGKEQFEKTLTDYQQSRPPGDKQHARFTDVLAASRSPMMLHRVPVAKMFFQGAPRLLAAGVCILPCYPIPSCRIVLEGYPALVARRWIGKQSYKSDDRRKQTAEQLLARRRIVNGLRSPALYDSYGVQLDLADELAEQLVQEPMGDELDAVLCAIQAAWAYGRREHGYGIPVDCDANEGWIIDPALYVVR